MSRLAKETFFAILATENKMNAKRDNLTAKTAQPIPIGERREAARRILEKASKPHLLDAVEIREATPEARTFADTLEPLAKRCLARGKRKVA